jgi:hypothetical protein
MTFEDREGGVWIKAECPRLVPKSTRLVASSSSRGICREISISLIGDFCSPPPILITPAFSTEPASPNVHLTLTEKSRSVILVPQYRSGLRTVTPCGSRFCP